MGKARSIKERQEAGAKAISALAECHPEDLEQIVSSILETIWQGPDANDPFSTAEWLERDARGWANTATDQVLLAYHSALTEEVTKRKAQSAQRAAFAKLNAAGRPPLQRKRRVSASKS